MKFCLQTISALYKSKGYNWGEFNIFGIRTVKNGDRVPNTFSDIIGVAYYEPRLLRWIYSEHDATTIAGLFYFRNPMRVVGTGILAEGFYEDCWRLGLHKGQYDALIQVRPMLVYRDGDKDDIFEIVGEPRPELAGINLHRAHDRNTIHTVGAYSALCQVIQSPDEYNELVKVWKARRALQNKQTYSYALFNIDEVTEMHNKLFNPKVPAPEQENVFVQAQENIEKVNKPKPSKTDRK